MYDETLVLGGGCFWCTEAVFKLLKEVKAVEPGYSSGTNDKIPVEVIKVTYDLDCVSFEELLRVFFASHDPTTRNRQGNDVGLQYRSVIFYTTPRQQEKAQHYIHTLNKYLAFPIVTTVEPYKSFTLASEDKNFYDTHRGMSYCELVIRPKVEKVQEKFPALVHSDEKRRI